MHGVQGSIELTQYFRFVLGYDRVIGRVGKTCDDPHIGSTGCTAYQDHIRLSVFQGVKVIEVGFIYLYIQMNLIAVAEVLQNLFFPVFFLCTADRHGFIVKGGQIP